MTDFVFMLAGDQRWQFEEWCDGHGVDRRRISDVKALIVDAFLTARDRSPHVADCGSLLLDEQYASPQIARARAAGVFVGTPSERAGSLPLEWAATTRFDAPPPARFVKVLIKDRPDYDAGLRHGQFDKLVDLQRWCRSHATPLVIEILVPRADEPGEAFEDSIRPAMLRRAIEDAYARGVEPDFWKIEGTTSAEAAAAVDAAIAARPACRQIVLGKAAPRETIAKWFAAAAPLSSAAGFAIGRSIHWKPATAWLQGSIGSAEAVDAMASEYLTLISMYLDAGSGSPRHA